MFSNKIVWGHFRFEKLPEKLRRYAPTKGNQEKTARIIDIIDIMDLIDILDHGEKKREKIEK